MTLEEFFRDKMQSPSLLKFCINALKILIILCAIVLSSPFSKATSFEEAIAHNTPGINTEDINHRVNVLPYSSYYIDHSYQRNIHDIKSSEAGTWTENKKIHKILVR